MSCPLWSPIMHTQNNVKARYTPVFGRFLCSDVNVYEQKCIQHLIKHLIWSILRPLNLSEH